jgi:hypothetical protein
MFQMCFQSSPTVTNIGGIFCPQPPVYTINKTTHLANSYNNTQISKKMSYAQNIRIQSNKTSMLSC